MNKKERALKIREAFNKLIKEGKEGAFVVFSNTETDKFVQFAYDCEGMVFVCDIPLAELSKSEEEKIRLFLGEYCVINEETNEKISYQEVFELDVINALTNLIEKIFTTAFGLGVSYEIESEIEGV